MTSPPITLNLGGEAAVVHENGAVHLFTDLVDLRLSDSLVAQIAPPAPPLDDVDTARAALRILLEAAAVAFSDPDTQMTVERRDEFLVELDVARAVMGWVSA